MIKNTITVEIHKNGIDSVENFSGNSRYIVVNESLSCGECFDYSIVDTKEGIHTYGSFWKKIMCETMEKDEADKLTK